eukprot:gene8765-14457_t
MMVRTNIDLKDLQKKGREAAKAIYEGRKVHIRIRHTMNAQDSALMIIQACEYVQQEADIGTSIACAFRQELPAFSKTGATCILSPLSEGQTRSKLIDPQTMQQLAEAYQRAQNEDFERKVQEQGEGQRQRMEEARRRLIHGRTEDWLSWKERSVRKEEDEQPWSEPATAQEQQQLEHNATMRL